MSDDGLVSQRASDAVRFAASLGVEAEATVSIATRFHAEARDVTITKLERSTSSQLSMRLFRDGRRASLVTSDFRRDALEDAIRAAVEQCSVMYADPLSGLPDTCGAFEGDLKLFDQRVEANDDAQKVDDALAIERIVRAYDARITNSRGSHFSDGVVTVAHANSRGFCRSYRGTSVSRASAPVAEMDGTKRAGYYGSAARALRDVESNDDVARRAGQRSVELFGAVKPPTMNVPVIFERDVAAAILGDLFAACNAANVAVGNSWLATRLGERIGSDVVTIVDDGTLPGLLGSSPFDGEGVETRRTPVFESGVLKSFLFDTYYARRLGAATTGNAGGGGIGANNFYLAPGKESLQSLIAQTRRGVFVVETIGFATEHATGTYSRGARGFLIENGELTNPIDECTVAGSFPNMLAAIDAVADDAVFDGSIVSPSFRVAEMTVSGN